MKNRRLLLSVIIKLLSFLGLMLLLLVFVNSLFTKDTRSQKEVEKELTVEIVTLDLEDMFKGQIRKVRWNNREVAVLLRQFPDKISNKNLDSNLDKNFDNNKPDSNNVYHSSIDKQLRSKNVEYFVYFNIGDSGNCPLFYAAGIFKDICSLNTFDETGRSITVNSQQFEIDIPPHYFENGNLFIGKWLH